MFWEVKNRDGAGGIWEEGSTLLTFPGDLGDEGNLKKQVKESREGTCVRLRVSDFSGITQKLGVRKTMAMFGREWIN